MNIQDHKFNNTQVQYLNKMCEEKTFASARSDKLPDNAPILAKISKVIFAPFKKIKAMAEAISHNVKITFSSTYKRNLFKPSYVNINPEQKR